MAIRKEPGITSTQVAKKIGVAPSQVHAISKVLVNEKLIIKDGPRYTETASATVATAKD